MNASFSENAELRRKRKCRRLLRTAVSWCGQPRHVSAATRLSDFKTRRVENIQALAKRR